MRSVRVDTPQGPGGRAGRERSRSWAWHVVILALSLPLLGPLGCTSNPAQFMGSGQPDAWQRSPGESLRSAGMQVGVVVGAAVLVVGGVIALLYLMDDSDDERLGPQEPWP